MAWCGVNLKSSIMSVIENTLVIHNILSKLCTTVVLFIVNPVGTVDDVEVLCWGKYVFVGKVVVSPYPFAVTLAGSLVVSRSSMSEGFTC